VSQLPTAITFVALTALLAGCAATPAEEPSAARTSAGPTASVSAMATPSAVLTAPAVATPSSPASQTPGAAPVETPVEVPSPEPTAEAPVQVAAATTWEAAPRLTAAHGSSFIVTSTGYQPGQSVLMSMGIYQTDSTDVDEQTAVADASGSVSYTVNVTPDIAPNTYGLVTLVIPGQGTGEDMEASKRFALVDVVG
jgi:hypothetical protein